jgi:predicted porin
VVETPVQGLRLGASAYAGHELGSNRRRGVGAQVEYLAGPWSVRSEYARESVKDDLEAYGFYAEVAYHIDPHWQVAAQYGRLTTDLPPVPEPATPSLLSHEEVALGLNYWWTPNFVLKLSFHHVEGNRFAGPDPRELAQAAASGSLREKTNLVLFGAQFSF